MLNFCKVSKWINLEAYFHFNFKKQKYSNLMLGII